MTGTDLATAKPAGAVKPRDRMRGLLETVQPQMAAVLPAHVTPQRFVQVTMAAVGRNAKLLDCNSAALLNEAMRCATDGLVPDGSEAALVPYGSKVSYIPMVKGLTKLAFASGVVTGLVADLVHEGDEFRVWTDERGAHVKHVPDLMDPDREDKPVLHAFAVASTRGGGRVIERMSAKQIAGIRAMSKARYADAPWNTHTHEMMKKTVLRRLFKRLPVSIAPMWMEGVVDAEPDTVPGPVLAVNNDAADDDGVVDAEVDELDTFAGGSSINGTAETVAAQGDDAGVDDKAVEQGQTRPPEDEADWSPLVTRAYAVAEGGGAVLAAWRDGLSEGEMEEVRVHLPALNAAARQADAEGVS